MSRTQSVLWALSCGDHANTVFLQVFLWEWFVSLSPKPTQLDAVEMIEVEEDGEIVKKPNRSYQPRALRWSGMKQNNTKNLSKVIDIKKNFNFRPYAFASRGIPEIQL